MTICGRPAKRCRRTPISSRRLELEKEGLDPFDPRIVEITRQIEHLMRAMTTKATAQRELVEEIQGASSSSD